MDLPIDPSNINHDNLPTVVGAMAVMIQDNCETSKALDKKIDQIDGKVTGVQEKIDKYESCYSALRVSFCTVVPWIKKHKLAISIVISGVTLWWSVVDWVNRYLQWTFFPPGTGP